MSNQHNPIKRNTLIATGIPNKEGGVVYVTASYLYESFLEWMTEDLRELVNMLSEDIIEREGNG